MFRISTTAAVLGLALLAGAVTAGAVDAPTAPRDRHTLHLGGISFDPAAGAPALPAGLDRSAESGPDLHLVQLDGPVQKGQRARLEELGLKVLRHIHPHTYVVWGERAKRALADAETFVRWTGDFAPAYRLRPADRGRSAEAVEVSVLLVRKADPKRTIARLTQLGARNTGRRSLDASFDVGTFVLPGELLERAAAIPGVYSVRVRPTDGGLRGELTDQINVNNVDGTNQAFPGYPAWLASVGLDGSGVVIANVDGGVNDAHPDLVNRILPCTGSTCGGSASSSHGTHTAGIMAADGSSGTLDPNGFLRGLGVAPGANLVEQVYSPTFTQAGGMLTLMQQSSENGADLSGNSWGPSGSPQGYDDDTMQVDIGVRDAESAVPGNQEFTYVLSFMNGYGGTNTQGSPDEAKNLFNIGSTKGQNGDLSQILEIDDLSSNTAHGPALDGRTIPHLVAPGCNVDSTDTAGGGYGTKCGTSMASPHVTGAVALFFEYYRGLPLYESDPSPALVKAAFLVEARDLEGNDDADGITLGHRFDSKQGWGRMDLEAVVDPTPNSVQYFDQEVLFDATDEQWSRSFSPLEPGEPVKVMLVWTDAPGHGLGGATPAWNNDLDLVVESGGDTYLGNVFGADGWSATGGAADFMNNTEGVMLASAPGGITVRVVAADINSDGVPGVGDETDQDFALVCSNCAAEPGYTLGLDPNAARVCAPAGASIDVSLTPILGFADPVTLSTSGVPAGASAGFSANPVAPPGSATLDLDPGSAAAGSYEVLVLGSGGGVDRDARVNWTIDTAVPAAAAPSAPADAALDVSPATLLQWSPIADAASYTVEVASDPGFNDIVASTTTTDPSWTVDPPLDTVTQYWWRVTATNSCGTGATSAAFSFTTLDVPPILLVDDDDSSPDVRAAYFDALTALGLAFDIWDTNNSDDEPTAAQLAPYESVIWFTGDEFGGAAGPGSAGESALSTWLDQGGCLLVASQDYHYDRDQTALMSDYLGVSSVDNDTGQATATGVGLFGGLGPFTLSFPYTNYTDTLVPDATGAMAFDGDQGGLAVSKDGGAYRTTFWGFGLEAIAAEADRQALLSTFLGWCGELAPDGDGDGYQDSEDCAPGDGTTWSAPGPVSNLTLTESPADNLSWLAPAEPGSASVSYDLLRAGSPTGFGSAACVESGGADLLATDADVPASGVTWYYLIRANNACGAMSGYDSTGAERPPAVACP